MNRRILLTIAAIAVVLVGISLIWLASGDDGDTETLRTTTSTTEAATTTNPDTTTSSAPASTTTSNPSTDGFPVTIETQNGPVTIASKPERIVSISPTSTEVLFAVGAGGEVVAVDDQSDYPEDAPVTDLTGLAPNVEAIASYDPDVVFVSFDAGDVIAGLEALDIPVILHPTALSVDDAYLQWEQTGAATGHVGEAADLVASTATSIAASVESVPEAASGLTYYYELDPTYYSATSSTFVGSLFSLTSMENIADSADSDGFGFPQLTSEYIVDEDPSLIYLADTKCCQQTAETVAQRPGWDTLGAVAAGAIVELDDDVASRWGPRITELVDDIVAGIIEMEFADA